MALRVCALDKGYKVETEGQDGLRCRFSEDGKTMYLTEIIGGVPETRGYPVDEEDRRRVLSYLRELL